MPALLSHKSLPRHYVRLDLFFCLDLFFGLFEMTSVSVTSSVVVPIHLQSLLSRES